MSTPAYCFDCRSNVRGTQVEHTTTKRHFRSTRPRIKRRSRRSYQWREGVIPSACLSRRDEDPYYIDLGPGYEEN